MSVNQNFWTHDYINANGIKLHYVTQGEGKLMLMLHGFPEFWYSWRYQIPEFANNYQVVALDLRGYNESDKPKDKSAYVMQKFIQDIESPQFLKQSLNAIKKANQNHSQKLKGSHNRERARKNLARRHEDVTNRRGDWCVEVGASTN